MNRHSETSDLSSSSSVLAVVLALLFLLCFTGLVLWRMEPGSPNGENTPLSQFSARRAFRHVERFARSPHDVGTPEQVNVRHYLVDQLRGIGCSVQEQSGVGIRSLRTFVSAGSVTNVIARFAGRDPSRPAVMLSAHYDSVATGPGAADDGSGVATLLEIARALKTQPPTLSDIVLLCTDGEECGLLGAQVFVRDSPTAKHIGVALNLEARGRGGPLYLFETSDGNLTGTRSGNAGLIRAYSSVVRHPLAHSLAYALYKQLPNDTDLTEFRKGGTG